MHLVLHPPSLHAHLYKHIFTVMTMMVVVVVVFIFVDYSRFQPVNDVYIDQRMGVRHTRSDSRNVVPVV